MSLLSLAFLGLLAPALQDPAAPVIPVGEFSDMRHTEEHAYGYTVQLWRTGDRILGLFMASAGLAGDTPTGILENVRFDPRSGNLSFSAKLTMGLAYMGMGKSEPSRDFFEFQGKLGPDALAGTLQVRDMLQNAPPKSLRIRLRKRPARQTLLEQESYGDWTREAARILERRGPKW